MLEVSFTKALDQFTLHSSFTCENEVLGILGSSGCGKSLTLKCIAGLQTPDSGSILLNGKPLYDRKNNINIPSRKRNIGYVFQNYALFPHLTVAQNIGYGISHLSKEIRKVRTMEMIDKIQLTGYENRYPSQLSGGQQQRVALARTLITDPELLLLDEPFSALDSHVKQLLEKELLRIIKNNFKGNVLLVTHSVEEAYRLCDRILIFDQGRTVQIGRKEDILAAPSTLTSARITGCKNILEAEIVEEEQEYAVLKSKNLIFRSKKAPILNSYKVLAGIRAHDLRLDTGTSDETNTFSCKIIEKIEGIFSTTVIVNCEGIFFQVEVSKYNFNDLQKLNSKDLSLTIPAEKVFLINTD